MRFSEGGALTAEGQTRRKDVRLQAGRLFEQDMEFGAVIRPCPSGVIHQ
jgi:hypothetical protein